MEMEWQGGDANHCEEAVVYTHVSTFGRRETVEEYARTTNRRSRGVEQYKGSGGETERLIHLSYMESPLSLLRVYLGGLQAAPDSIKQLHSIIRQDIYLHLHKVFSTPKKKTKQGKGEGWQEGQPSGV
jgi:hypothetical protein